MSVVNGNNYGAVVSMIDGEALGDVLGVVEIEIEGGKEVKCNEEGCGVGHEHVLLWFRF